MNTDRPIWARLCPALTSMGYRTEPGVITTTSNAETFNLLITWQDGACLKVMEHQLRYL